MTAGKGNEKMAMTKTLEVLDGDFLWVTESSRCERDKVCVSLWWSTDGRMSEVGFPDPSVVRVGIIELLFTPKVEGIQYPLPTSIS
jgi:hypothetical protein